MQSERQTEILSFTESGAKLAEKLAQHFQGRAQRCPRDIELKTWTEGAFASATCLIFIGATGIAVRAIAPYLKSKSEDPAVLVIDNAGRYVISLCSGHLGGANALAQKIAKFLNAQAIVTTASDQEGIFPVDEWARVQGLKLRNPEKIKHVTSQLLAGETVNFHSALKISGNAPPGLRSCIQEAADFVIDYRNYLPPLAAESLQLVPPNLYLGIGCRRGTEAQAIEAAFAEVNIAPEAILGIGSIELKADELGLLQFAEAHGWETKFFSAEELAAQPGEFSESPFVRLTTGVGNVCERSAVALAGGGKLMIQRTVKNGVTLALARRKMNLDWRWQDEE